MSEQSRCEKNTLLLALVTGFSVSGSWLALFSSVIPFSIFPFIALILSVYCLQQRYQRRAMAEGVPSLVAGCFVLGLLLYSAFTRVEYPQIGSNFLPTLLSVILVFWLGIKLKSFNKQHHSHK